MDPRRPVWAHLKSTDTRCGSGVWRRIRADYTGEMGIKSRCMATSGKADTSIFASVVLEKCAATGPRWRKAHRVRRKSVPLHPPFIRPIAPTDFLDVLRGWGQTWIWDDLKVTGGTDWLAQAIADNSLVAVTDGSYIREHHPELLQISFQLSLFTKFGDFFHKKSLLRCKKSPCSFSRRNQHNHLSG